MGFRAWGLQLLPSGFRKLGFMSALLAQDPIPCKACGVQCLKSDRVSIGFRGFRELRGFFLGFRVGFVVFGFWGFGARALRFSV